MFVAPHKLTVGELLHTWLWEYKWPKLRSITFESYEMLIRKHVITGLGHIPLKDLRPEHVQRFYNEKAQEGLSYRTVRYLHTTLNSALGQAEKNQLVVGNVSKFTESPSETRKEMSTFSLALQMSSRQSLRMTSSMQHFPLYLQPVYDVGKDWHFAGVMLTSRLGFCG